MTRECDKESFKEQLALVFDDDLKTRPLRWNNYLDIIIIAVILLSTVSGFPVPGGSGTSVHRRPQLEKAWMRI